MMVTPAKSFPHSSAGVSDGILKRIKRGEALLLDASLSYQSRFYQTGELVPHQVMQGLLDREVVVLPPKRGMAWVLRPAPKLTTPKPHLP